MTTVNCPVCGKVLPIDFHECPDCACKNPQLHLVERIWFKLSIAPEVARTMKVMAIRKGWSIDRFMTEALEFYITSLRKDIK